jgi:hypothetical protein
MTTLPPRQVGYRTAQFPAARKLKGRAQALPCNSGAGKESRTPDLNLGKVALYQLSYSRMYTADYYIQTERHVKTRSDIAGAAALSNVKTSRMREIAFSSTAIDVANDMRK